MSVGVARVGLMSTGTVVAVVVGGSEYGLVGHGVGRVWHGTSYLHDVGLVWVVVDCVQGQVS